MTADELTSDEREIIIRYRALNAENRKHLRVLLDGLQHNDQDGARVSGTDGNVILGNFNEAPRKVEFRGYFTNGDEWTESAANGQEFFFVLNKLQSNESVRSDWKVYSAAGVLLYDNATGETRDSAPEYLQEYARAEY